MPYQCVDCGREYTEPTGEMVELCPRCCALYRAIYGRSAGVELPDRPWEYSKAAMRERLNVTGNEDV